MPALGPRDRLHFGARVTSRPGATGSSQAPVLPRPSAFPSGAGASAFEAQTGEQRGHAFCLCLEGPRVGEALWAGWPGVSSQAPAPWRGPHARAGSSSLHGAFVGADLPPPPPYSVTPVLGLDARSRVPSRAGVSGFPAGVTLAASGGLLRESRVGTLTYGLPFSLPLSPVD